MNAGNFILHRMRIFLISKKSIPRLCYGALRMTFQWFTIHPSVLSLYHISETAASDTHPQPLALILLLFPSQIVFLQRCHGLLHCGLLHEFFPVSACRELHCAENQHAYNFVMEAHRALRESSNVQCVLKTVRWRVIHKSAA